MEIAGAPKRKARSHQRPAREASATGADAQLAAYVLDAVGKMAEVLEGKRMKACRLYMIGVRVLLTGLSLVVSPGRATICTIVPL